MTLESQRWHRLYNREYEKKNMHADLTGLNLQDRKTLPSWLFFLFVSVRVCVRFTFYSIFSWFIKLSCGSPKAWINSNFSMQWYFYTCIWHLHPSIKRRWTTHSKWSSFRPQYKCWNEAINTLSRVRHGVKATRGSLNANFHISCWPPLVALTIFAESSQPYGPGIWWSAVAMSVDRSKVSENVWF